MMNQKFQDPNMNLTFTMHLLKELYNDHKLFFLIPISLQTHGVNL